MARGALRGAAGAWLGLIALQTLTTGQSSSKVGGAFDWVASVFSRALDPKVPAIPDHSKTAAAGNVPNPYFNGMTLDQLNGAVSTGQALGSSSNLQTNLAPLTSLPTLPSGDLSGLAGLANLDPQALASLVAAQHTP